MPKRARLPRWFDRLGQWAALFGLYLLFVGEVSKTELLVGGLVSALGVVAWTVTWEERLSAVFADLRLLALARYLVIYAFTGTWEMLAVLAAQLLRRRPAESLFRTVAFDVGGDDPRSATRRALAVGYTSITPNFIVLDIDRTCGQLLYHQVRESEVLEMTRRLGARG